MARQEDKDGAGDLLPMQQLAETMRKLSNGALASLHWGGNQQAASGEIVYESLPELANARMAATARRCGQPVPADRGNAYAIAWTLPRSDGWLTATFSEDVASTTELEAQLQWLRTQADFFLERHALYERIASLEKAERVQQALFAIANLANSDQEMHAVLRGIHQTVAGLMYAENFYIALYDESRQTLKFVYFVDAFDPDPLDVHRELPVAELSNSLTWGLIRRGKPMTGPSIAIRTALGITGHFGNAMECEHWLGVPLLDGSRVRGALVVQSYDTALSYTRQDVDLLCFVAQHILTTIDRKQAHDQLEQRVLDRTEALAQVNADLRKEVEVRRRAEQLQAVQHQIAELSMSTIEMEAFYRQVHLLVSDLLIADNFVIALLAACGTNLEFPYSVDHKDPPPPPRPLRHGLTEYVIRSRMPLLADRQRIVQLQANGEATAIGTIPASWMGVPLLADDAVLGVIAVQSYSNDVLYGGQDQELLGFVALHIANGLQRRRAQDKIVHLALHDTLTGLPNRALFMEQLGIAGCRRQRDPRANYGVLFLDLDRFKLINDSMGHHAGDALLKVTAQRLAASIRPQDTVSRFGGDEFAVLINGVAARADAVQVAERILAALDAPIVVEANEVFITSSIGIAFPDSHDCCAEELLRNADTAMYRAKRLGRGRWHVFDDALHHEAVEALALETDLRRAAAAGQFEPFFQPIVCLGDGRAVGYEALLRWRHDTRGLLAPAAFLAAAEDCSLLEAIDWLIYEAAAVEASKRLSAEQYVSVNVCPRNLNSPLFPERLFAMLARHGLDPTQLRIELTEGALLDDSTQVRECLLQLEQGGIKAMVDDFGAGYSALSYLHKFRFSALKVDRSFVTQLEQGTPSGIAIIRAVLGICEALGISVIAEGVESELQHGILQSLGCKFGQGYLYSRPFPAGDWPDSR